jgi:hypothetical protein
MCWFRDGPAADVKLMLARAPLLLRVTRSPDGTWDALDQLADTPAFDEVITVYRRATLPSNVHVNARGRCGWFQIAEYRVVDPQPRDEQVRTTTAWRRWAEEFVRPSLLEATR